MRLKIEASDARVMHASIMHQFFAFGPVRSDNDRIDSTSAADIAPTPGYPVGAVAARLGVPRATLRSWSQRYGLGPAGHLRGKHRLYTEADIMALATMVEMVQSGIPPASAADCVRRKFGQSGTASVDDDAVTLAAHAHRLDTTAMSELLDRSLRQRGVVATWNNLCRPAFATIVERQVDGACIDEEHALSWAVSGSLGLVARRMGLAQQPAGIVLACTPREHHVLSLEALAAALAEASTPVRMLGGDVPISALHDALERTRPAAVVLWSHAARTADVNAIEIGLHFADQVYVAGPGWPDRGLADGVVALLDIESACEELVLAGRQSGSGALAGSASGR